MNRIKGSVLTKMILWGVFLASAAAVVISGCLIIIGSRYDFYHKTEEGVARHLYERVNADYSEQAFHSRNNPDLIKWLAYEGFRFGIIESPTLDGIDLQDRDSFIATNLTDEELETLDKDALYLYQLSEYEDHSYMTTMMGYYGDHADISALDVTGDPDVVHQVYLYADAICYDVASGIVYYRSEGTYYPAQHVSISSYNGEEPAIYDYIYDFGLGAYRLEQISPSVSEDEDSAYAEVSAQERAHIEAILKGTDGVVDLSQLEGTVFGHAEWGQIVLDHIRRLDGSELILIDAVGIGEENFWKDPGYYLDENYTLVVEMIYDRTDYWVVSLLPDGVSVPGSRYDEVRWILDMYRMQDRNGMDPLLMLGCSILAAATALVLLACAAGYRRDREGIFLTWYDKIPLDILTAVMCAAECMLMFGGIYILSDVDIVATGGSVLLSFISMASIAMAALGAWYLLSLCVRIKNGKWWRNSICYWIIDYIRTGVSGVLRNMDLLWRTILITGVITMAGFFIIVETDRPFILFCWLIGQIVLCAFMLVLVVQVRELQRATRRMAEGDLGYKIDTSRMFWECRKHGDDLNRIGEGISKAVDARMKSERFKTELITNVSHDIKTPLTSIINYVDLLEKEELDNERAVEYLEVLERQSSKLKKLIEDLVEASKASSGNLAVDYACLDLGVFITQTVGEFEEKLSGSGIELLISRPEEPVYVMADGRHLWRVADNLMNNICKYAQQGTRVYVDLGASDRHVHITFRNVSRYPLNMNGEELMERFVRGDRSRNTEGHGLGLSIAQSLVRIMGGEMTIVVDGDLFKVILTFDRHEPAQQEDQDSSVQEEAAPSGACPGDEG